MQAAKEADLKTAQAVCDRCESGEMLNELYQYVASICIRRFDRVVNCFVSSSGSNTTDSIFTSYEPSMEVGLSPLDCCAAR